MMASKDYINHNFTVKKNFRASLDDIGDNRKVNLTPGDKGFILGYKEVEKQGAKEKEKQVLVVAHGKNPSEGLILPVSTITVGERTYGTEEVKYHGIVLRERVKRDGVELNAGDFVEGLAVSTDGLQIRVQVVRKTTDKKTGKEIKQAQAVALWFHEARVTTQRNSNTGNVLHRRFTLISDHEVTAHDLILQDTQKGLIEDWSLENSSITGRMLDQKTSFHIPLKKVKIHSVLMKNDLVQHTFKMRKPSINTRDNVERKLATDASAASARVDPAVGIILKADPDNFKATVHVKHPFDFITDLTMDMIYVGFKIESRYNVMFEQRNTLRTRALVSAKAAPTQSELKSLVAQLFENISSAATLFPNARYDVIDLMRDSIPTATSFVNSVNSASPWLVSVIMSDHCTIEEILKHTQPAQEGNRKAGIYLRIYWQFPKDSPFFGMVYIYVGMTVDFQMRDRFHVQAGKESETLHYRVYRAAEQRRVVQLSVLSANLGGSATAGLAYRKAFEQAWILILQSYQNTLINWDSVSTGADETSVAMAAAGARDFAENAFTLTVLARRAFKGSSLANETRSKHGQLRGLNVSSPINESSKTGRIRWIRTETEDRYIYRRQPVRAHVRAGLEGHVLQSFGLHTLGDENTWRPPIPADPDHGLVEGAVLHVAIEVMKNFKPHPAPHFQLPDCGQFDNWLPHHNSGNSIGLRLTWKTTGGVWKEKMVQQWEPRPRAVAQSLFFVNDEPGSYRPYAIAMGLLSYFDRFRWYDPPSFYFDFGIADVYTPQTNHFRQETSLVRVNDPIPTVPAPRRNIDAAANYMRDTLKLDNVGGNVASLDTSTATKDSDPSCIAYYNSGISRGITASRIINNWTIRRERCDYHIVFRMGATGQPPTGPTAGPSDQCYPSAKDPTRCEMCFKWGRPCSWTFISKLAGQRWYDNVVGHWASALPRDVVKSGPIVDEIKALHKAFVRQPLNETACQIHTPPTPPNFVNVDPEAGTEEYAGLLAQAIEEMD